VSQITSLSARTIADSRGNPTIEVTLSTINGQGVASVPSGASVGIHEAKVVESAKAAAQINTEVSVALAGKEFNQQSLDDFLIRLDGTQDKARLGGNAILGISLAFARAAAAEQKVELYQYLGGLAGVTNFLMPTPMFNVLNGGKHAHNGVAIQEYMVVPQESGIKQQVESAQQIVESLRALLAEKRYESALGDEGGFAPRLKNNEEGLELLSEACVRSGANRCKLALDIAASSMEHFDKEKMSAWYASILKKYPLVSIEDPFTEDDWDGFSALRASAGERVLVVGDDLTVTNPARIALAAQKKAINAVIIKPNQVGTVSETIAAVASAHAHGWKAIASHRSGETLDVWIADVAVGLGCEYIKAGAPTKPERSQKYTRLIEIEKTLS